jgi:hypothetical protein
MNYNYVNWYEFIYNNHFKERNVPLPSFFKREFVAFKLPETHNPPITARERKVFETKQKIYNQIHTMSTTQLIILICDTSFINLSSTSRFKNSDGSNA